MNASRKQLEQLLLENQQALAEADNANGTLAGDGDEEAARYRAVLRSNVERLEKILSSADEAE